METTISLQGPFSYSLVPIFLSFLLFLIALLIYVAVRISQRGMQKEKGFELEKQIKPVVKNKGATKGIYLMKLDDLQKKYRQDQLSDRDLYQELSSLVREFAFEMTGKKVTTMTLTEIQRVGLPQLKTLIEEYYEPEFAQDAEIDAAGALKRARRVIDEWI